MQAIADQVLLKASGAGIALSSEASVDGRRVLLNSPASASDSVEPSSTEPTIVELVDQYGNPIPNHPFRILFEDGTEQGGALDRNGRAELFLDRSGTVVFPGLSDVEAT